MLPSRFRSATPSTGEWRQAADPVAANWKIDAPWLLPLLIVFAVKGALLVAMIGPFTGHDEVDHFFYVQRLAQGNGLGVVGEVTLPPEAKRYRAYVANYPTNAEVIQPPLYHLLLVPLYLLTPGGIGAHLALLRLASVAIGGGVVWLAYLTARLLAPGDILIRAGIPIFVAFQPQFAFEASIVNHDVLLILLVSLVVYLTLRGMRDGFTRRGQWTIGLISAAGLWTKISFGLVLPVVVVGLLLAAREARSAWRELLGPLLRTVGLPLVLASPWFVRSLLLYGDPTGAGRLRQIPEFGAQAQTYGRMITSGPFWRQLLEDFWGNYGWRQIPLDPTDFRLIWLLWGVALAGLLCGLIRVGWSWRRGRGVPWTPFQCRGIVVLALSVALMIYGVLYVGTIQFTQARFAFPAMIGFATLTILGLSGWLPARARPFALPVLVALLMALNAVVLLRFLLPFYDGPGGGAAIAP
jgi:4-amino-4-deoxy-L-arabinose transferase-like glycosyltransferase